MRTQTLPTTPVHEETPEDRRLAAAYRQEREAIQAPTSHPQFLRIVVWDGQPGAQYALWIKSTAG
jgi:hypothetical protein